ncbi:SDR family oxidoreductase [Parvularcula dongshanensis]|uniref:NAD(P)-dependent dehydrogenase (Short-subunit alcohol dehydrogenase family) n=1 Tax=Parvularcula dongshanensis TaxID=1173995 RepID=A0A840I2B9_9PROT|nr:SDR family oxidoreductase [Parvularcula dongshanensis]MBB4658338.1 NAD(P)-dependent dehydrogenase (short-subunit alcohol dehydrogenase family) [Parvularcula dongshanensis]
MPTALITGANRGIGLELTRAYAAEGYKVHACCRTPSQANELRDVEGDVTIHALEVTDHGAVDALATEIKEPIDVLIANAGVYGPGSEAQTFGSLDYGALRDTLETNLLGTVKTCEAFLPQVAQSGEKKMAAITSKMGSIADASGGSVIYRTSKAALNMAMAVAAPEAKRQGVAVAVLHPGWVQTDMGGPNGNIDAKTSAAGLKERIAGLKPADKAPFLAYDGQEIPW